MAAERTEHSGEPYCPYHPLPEFTISSKVKVKFALEQATKA